MAAHFQFEMAVPGSDKQSLLQYGVGTVNDTLA